MITILRISTKNKQYIIRTKQTFQAYSNYRKSYIYKVTVSDNIETGTSGNYKHIMNY